MSKHTREGAVGRAARRRRFALTAALVAAVCALGLARLDPVEALTRADLYQATVPVSDRSEAAQSAAFEAALRVVLVRVTGRRAAADDATLAPLLKSARRYVQQYRAAGDGSIWVAFDAAAIERWLTQNGQPLWGHSRPVTAIFVAVPGAAGGPQTGTVLTQEDTSDLKQAIDAAADARGAPLLWPSAADLQRDHLDFAAVAGASAGTLADLAHRLGGEGTLVGRVGAAGAVRWSLAFQDRTSEFAGDVAEGPNRAADLYAGIFAVSGAVEPVEVEVAGIEELKDYALALSYLESLALVTHVAVEGLGGDAVRFQLTARGGADALEHVVALDARLAPIAASDNGILRFQLRR